MRTTASSHSALLAPRVHRKSVFCILLPPTATAAAAAAAVEQVAIPELALLLTPGPSSPSLHAPAASMLARLLALSHTG